jgi:proliferating cell nuclear antigen
MKLSIHSKNQAKCFTNVFTNLGSLTESVVLYINEDGLYIQGMDSSHVSLYEAKFEKSWFSTYKREDDDVGQISLRLDYFKKILSTRGDDQIIYIEYSNKKPDIITIIFRSMSKNSKEFPREYEMSLMDIDTETINIPNDEQSVQFYMDTKMFSSLVKQLIMFDDTVVIRCNEEEIKFKSKGSEGSMTVELFDNEKDYVSEFIIDEGYRLNISFALRYFDCFGAFQKVCDSVRLSFTNDYPVEVYYSLDVKEKKEKPSGDVNEDAEGTDSGSETNEVAGSEENSEPKSYLRFMLAPKMEDDNDDKDGGDGSDTED